MVLVPAQDDADEIERVDQSEKEVPPVDIARAFFFRDAIFGEVDFVGPGQEAAGVEGVEQDAVEEHDGAVEDVEEGFVPRHVAVVAEAGLDQAVHIARHDQRTADVQ